MMKKTILFCCLLLSSCAMLTLNKDAVTSRQFLDAREKKILVNISEQKLYLLAPHNQIITSYPISSGRTGTGEINASGKTPRGMHIIGQKIGDEQPTLQAYKARQPIGLYSANNSKGKHILARILTLNGQEPYNKNTKARYVYIHGTPNTRQLGTIPVSSGCIRMNPKDIVELFELVNEHMPVYIYDDKNPLPRQRTIHQVANALSYVENQDTTWKA
ncbi:MAG: L,D-transpeptidase [Pseudomonadota bacterium]|nr:L,D-transpeptidase [Pseudomonadota bacterium]